MAEDILPKRIAIIGGGISGLVAARKLAAEGAEVHIYEASPQRLGGKIRSLQLGNRGNIDSGAEFVDSDHIHTRQLLADLGLNLIPANDQRESVFQMKDGSIISEKEFLAAYSPLAQQIIRDKQIIADDPEGERAKHIDKLSMTEYLEELSANVPPPRPQSWLERIKHVFTGGKNGVDPTVLEMAAQAYSSEVGRDPQKIAAMQFINEASPAPDAFLASDAGWRIEGGTEALIKTLEEDLKKKGVQFHMGTKADAVDKRENGKFSFKFEGGPGVSEEFDQIVMALPMHALAEIKGLEELGLSKKEIKLLREGQYTSNAKISIATNQDAPFPFFISNDGFQAWAPRSGVVTFLVGSEKLLGMKKRDMIEHLMTTYAKANGTTADKMFDPSQMVVTFPGKDNPCYASPTPGQTLELQHLAEAFSRLAQHGIGIVGTYLPCHDNNNGIGFMECGTAAAERMTSIMTSRDRALMAVKDRLNYDGMAAGAPPVLSGNSRHL